MVVVVGGGSRQKKIKLGIVFIDITVVDCKSIGRCSQFSVSLVHQSSCRIKTSFDEAKDLVWAYYGTQTEDPEHLAAHLGLAPAGASSGGGGARRNDREERELEKERSRRKVSRAMDWKKFLAESAFVIVKYK